MVMPQAEHISGALCFSQAWLKPKMINNGDKIAIRKQQALFGLTVLFVVADALHRVFCISSASDLSGLSS
jgi:hypothetical protein